METIIKYKSFDGRVFDDELECLRHELDILESKSELQIYGKYNKKLHIWYSEVTYNQSRKVVIPSKAAIDDLRRIQDYCGFYCDIPAKEDSIGTWRFNDTYERFEKL